MMDKDTLRKKVSIDEELMDMEVAILTKYHLSPLGKTMSLEDISAVDFKRSLFPPQDYEKAHLVIYFDERGVRCLKRKYSYEHTDIYMNHLGFDFWTF